MWDLIVSVPDHCLSFYFLKTFTKNFNFFSNADANANVDAYAHADAVVTVIALSVLGVSKLLAHLSL